MKTKAETSQEREERAVSAKHSRDRSVVNLLAYSKSMPEQDKQEKSST